MSSTINIKKNKNYLKNSELFAEIILSKKNNELTERAQKMLILLANKVSTKLKYKNPEDRKDCISFAYLDILKYWRGFDPAKSSNAFAYYTEMIKKGFAKGWNHLHPKKYAGTLSLDGGLDDGSEGIYSI